MKNEDIIKELPEIKSKDFEIEEIHNVNHKPHPYCITPAHLKNEFMCLGEKEILEAEKNGAKCGMYEKNGRLHNGYISGGYRCQYSYEQHTSDRVLFIKALRKTKSPSELKGLKNWLKKAGPILEKYKLDGVAFIEYNK